MLRPLVLSSPLYGTMRSPASLLEIGKIFAEREGYLQPAIKGVEIVADHAATAALKEMVVFVRADHPGEKRLAVYYVGTEKPEVLRGYLQAKLPRHMVPVVFMQIAAYH